MSILRMRMIVLLDRLKKVTAVADELGVKQPTISFHMRKMEEEWGAALFEIKTGKVLLTAAGAVLLRYAEQIDRIYAEAKNRLQELKASGRGRLVIGCTDAAAAAVLDAQWFAAAAETALQLGLVTGGESELAAKLTDGAIDIMVTGGVPAGLPGTVTIEPVREDCLALFVPEGHPLAAGEAPAPFKLAGSPFILPDDSSIREAARQWQTNENVKLNVAMTTDRIANALQAVKSGACLAILPSCAGNGFRDQGVQIVKLPGQPVLWRLTAAWRNDERNPQAAANRLIQRMR